LKAQCHEIGTNRKLYAQRRVKDLFCNNWMYNVKVMFFLNKKII